MIFVFVFILFLYVFIFIFFTPNLFFGLKILLKSKIRIRPKFRNQTQDINIMKMYVFISIFILFYKRFISIFVLKCVYSYLYFLPQIYFLKLKYFYTRKYELDLKMIFRPKTCFIIKCMYSVMYFLILLVVNKYGNNLQN